MWSNILDWIFGIVAYLAAFSFVLFLNMLRLIRLTKEGFAKVKRN